MIAAAAQLQPGLITSDINLGVRGMDGIAATIAIRRNALVVPVLFVTGHAGVDATARIGQDLPDAMLLRESITYADLQRALVGLSQAIKPN
jgi:CheY-like chemotaxis protein